MVIPWRKAEGGRECKRQSRKWGQTHATSQKAQAKRLKPPTRVPSEDSWQGKKCAVGWEGVSSQAQPQEQCRQSPLLDPGPQLLASASLQVVPTWQPLSLSQQSVGSSWGRDKRGQGGGHSREAAEPLAHCSRKLRSLSGSGAATDKGWAVI